MSKKVEKITVQGICNYLKVNKNTRAYIEHKYKNDSFILSEWRKRLKKDGLIF